MPPRTPRSSAASRTGEPTTSAATDDPATGAGDGSSRLVGDSVPPEAPGDAERSDVAGDMALLGAYALGALTPEERADVEERLAASPALRDELRRLIPVAALLREATDPPPTPVAATESSRGLAPETRTVTQVDIAPSVPATLSERSSPGFRPEPEPISDARDDPDSSLASDRIPAHEESLPPPEAVPDGPVDDSVPSPARVEATPGRLSSRPTRPPSRPAREPGPPRSKQARASTPFAGWPLSWLAAGLATLVAVGAVLWALAMVDRLDARREEVAALETEVRALRARGDAAVVALAPGEGGPAGADGVILVAPTEGSLIVRVSGLPASAEGRLYQVWFQGADDAANGGWIVGPVFRVGKGGTALVELPAAAPAFTRLAISDEPSPGGDSPSGPFLMEGTTNSGT